MRVASVQNVDVWTKAGLMIRETVAAGARHASLFVTPSTVKGVAFQRRTTATGTSVHTAGPAITAPVYLRLSRTGEFVNASYRQNASAAWVDIGTQRFPGLASEVLMGLAVTSHSDGRLATATFDGLDVVTPGSFQSYDIGSVGLSGITSVSGQTVTLEGSGADIWGTADAFRFHALQVTGNFFVRVRVKASRTRMHGRRPES